MNARRPDDALLNWRQIAAVVFAVGAVVASSPAVAAAAPDAEADSSTSADDVGDSGTGGDEAGAGAEADAEDATDGDDAAEEPDASEPDEAAEEPDDTEVDVEAPEDDAEELEEPDAEAESKTRGSHYESLSRPESGADAESDGDDEAVDADETTTETSTPEPTTPESSTPASSTPLSTTESAATTAEAPARTERPVNTATIVADVLTWVGLGDSAADLPIPALPVPRLVEMFWLAVRQTQHSWNNQRPTAQPTLSAQGDDGVIRGALNAVDYDDTELTYTVATPARFGTVVVNTDGTFTYTPRPGIVVVTDTFTVTIDDPNSGVHGLGEMLGWTGATTATVIVGGAGSTDVGSSNVTRPGAVTVQMGTDGRISVIDGTFTETKVYDKAGAAALLNTYAPVLNAQTGFATTDSITVHRVGGSGVVEEFYRLRQSVNGIEVIGSDVVLVTDGNGTVTGLFNYHDSRITGVDTTPDLAGGATVAALATAHLIGVTGARPDDTTVRRLIESASAKTELVILAQDRDAEPTLTWRVQVAGATYYIRANGDDAGEVMAGTSTAQALTVTAADLSGVDRTINVEPAKWWFLFDSQALIDTTRNLTTYATGFNFFGLGTPWLPGNPSTRSLLFGWNRAGVSAHANMAAVYDYYLAVLGRDSIDGNGAPVVASVGYNPRADLWTLITGYANAFWDAEGQQFVFGDSGGFEGGLDIVAHEYTHGVISHIVGNGNSVLDYGESGALNEAYADILGALIEDDLGSGRWLIGEDTSRPLRNLANPAAIGTGYRAHYDQRYIGPDDDGGEHWNSTIFSRAAYLMMTDSDAKAVSTDTWAKVFYNSLFRLSPGAKFVDGRAAILDTAAEYGFTDGQMQAVADAFDTVGIVGGSRSAGPEALTLIAL